MPRSVFILAAAAALLVAGAAEARPRTITVHPRSYLDPGRVAPVGTYNQYATVGQYPAQSLFFGTPKWETPLPDRFNPPGRNPFGPIDFLGQLN